MGCPRLEAGASRLSAAERTSRSFVATAAGFTDSHWPPEAFGMLAYGFFPARALPMELANSLIHSVDERVAIADLELDVVWLRHGATSALG